MSFLNHKIYSFLIMMLIALSLSGCGQVVKNLQDVFEPIAEKGKDSNSPPDNSSPLSEEKNYNVALILPTKDHPEKNASNVALKKIAYSMVQSANMAYKELKEKDITLHIYETNGSKKDVVDAFEYAIERDVDIILGPLTAQSVKEIKPLIEKEKIPTVAFSSDLTIAGGDYLYLLSYPMEQNIHAILDYSLNKGYDKFAFYGSPTSYAKRSLAYMRDYLREREKDVQTVILTHNKQDDHYLKLKQFIKELSPNDQENFVRHAILFADPSQLLFKSIPNLDRLNFPFDKHLIMGTGLWHEHNILRISELDNAVFAALDHNLLNVFEKKFIKQYGSIPSHVTTLAYDALSLVVTLIRHYPDNPFAKRHFLNSSGFLGIGGIFRFKDDGTTERGLSIIKIKDKNFNIVKQSPEKF